MIIRCVVCNKKLTDPESADRGVGSICEEKLDRETMIEIQKIIRQGWQPRILGDRVIGVTIPEQEDEWPQAIDRR